MNNFIKNGTDAEFNIPLGKDIKFSDDQQYYRIIGRYNVSGQGCFYEMKACSAVNPVQSLRINKDDEAKLTPVNCPEVIASLWEDLVWDGDYRKARHFVWNCMLAKCDVHAREVQLYCERDQLVFDFDGTILRKDKL